MMAEDRETLRKVWFGQLPICFQLSSKEIVSLQKPEPYYLMCSRVTYFPLVMDNVITYFSRYVHPSKQTGNDIWIEFEGTPLKWQYPIGLSWDLLSWNSKASLPWTLTVHFEDFPEERLVRCNNRSLIESVFMQTLKESDVLKRKEHACIMRSMQVREHNQLWSGLQNDKFEEFWAVNKKLMSRINGEHFRYIPCRIYYESDRCLQRPIKPTGDTGELATVGDLLKQFFPDQIDENDKAKVSVVTHGIGLPLETPLQWSSEHLSYPDNFLHLGIFPNSS